MGGKGGCQILSWYNEELYNFFGPTHKFCLQVTVFVKLLMLYLMKDKAEYK